MRAPDWTYAQIVCEVAADADSISFGGALNMHGKAWVDDLKLVVLGSSGVGNESPRALTKRGTENLIAFGRLLGYVRHFHPADEAAGADWNAFAISGVGEVENAGSPVELKARLERLFRPLAPTLRLSTKPLRPITADALRPPGEGAQRIIGWRHRGWPGPHQGFFDEKRIVAPAGAAGDSVLPIGAEVNTSLGGGVWCSLPLTLYVDERGTFPRGSGKATIPRRPEGWTPTGDDRATRIASVLLFWNVIQHFFPYFDVVDANWSAQLPQALREAAADPDGASFGVTLQRMSVALRDGHAFVRSPYSDVGMPLWPFEWSFVEGRLTFVRVDTTSVERAEIGDEVRTIQGRPVAEWVKEAEAVESGATPQDIRIRVARALMTMAGRDSLALTLRSPAGNTRHVVVKPQKRVSLAPARPDSVQELEPGVMYLDMNRITDADLLAALPKINAGRGVIFDLRGYPNRTWTTVISHLIDSTVVSCPMGVPFILRPDHADTTFTWSTWPVEPASPRIKARSVFLIDGNAISAAETLLGIVENYHLAALVGEPTAGTSGNVTSVRLPGGYSISFTGMKILKHDGSLHHGVGILPTIPVSRSAGGIADGRDEQLERAVELIHQ